MKKQTRRSTGQKVAKNQPRLTKAQILFPEGPGIRPSHYTQFKITAVDIIEEWGLDFYLGNVLKYIQRHKFKDSPITDLKKARTYLSAEIIKLELEREKTK